MAGAQNFSQQAAIDVSDMLQSRCIIDTMDGWIQDVFQLAETYNYK